MVPLLRFVLVPVTVPGAPSQNLPATCHVVCRRLCACWAAQTWREHGDRVEISGSEPSGGAVIYVFGDCELDLGRYQLRRAGAVQPVEPQVFDVLALLLRERGRVVSKEELLDAVWGSRFVGDSALTSRVKAARRAIGDDGRGQRMIRTAHGRGYQFVGEVVETEERTGRADVVAGAAPPQQEIRFCTASDGVRLAYATMGDGPPLGKE